MRADATVAVIVPALNEERSIGLVLAAIPGWVDDVIVADNGSTDRTAEIARAHGARVVGEPAPGYGAACLAGIAALDGAEVVVFLDGDHSDDAGSMAALVDPITAGEADMVLGSRVLGECEPGALSLHQRLGNRLACGLIRLTWRADYSDLGPFRALSYRALREIAMDEARPRLDHRDAGAGGAPGPAGARDADALSAPGRQIEDIGQHNGHAARGLGHILRNLSRGREPTAGIRPRAFVQDAALTSLRAARSASSARTSRSIRPWAISGNARCSTPAAP